MDAEQLRRALVEHGFHEAAAMVEADIERQAAEEESADDFDVSAHVRAAGGSLAEVEA